MAVDKPSRKRTALPERIMLDSNVVIRALDHDNPARKDDPFVADCRLLWERALRESRILMAPFVVLEVLSRGTGDASGNGLDRFPPVAAIEHVGFSFQAAERMSKWAKPRPLKTVTGESQAPRTVVKYDALIVATAAFHAVDVLVSLDADVKALAKLARVRVAEPKELLKGTQGKLFE